MIYADPSFLFSFYAMDGNTQAAATLYSADARRPLLFTPWQRFELRNAVRLAGHKLRRQGRTIPFQAGNVFKRVDEDLSAGRLKHEEPNWRETLQMCEELSELHTDALGCASVDLWHVASALVLKADTFWTFDGDQRALAKATGKLRRVPEV
jgi:hypothetical protein